jgi:hypothetical protein
VIQAPQLDNFKLPQIILQNKVVVFLSFFIVVYILLLNT